MAAIIVDDSELVIRFDAAMTHNESSYQAIDTILNSESCQNQRYLT